MDPGAPFTLRQDTPMCSGSLPSEVQQGDRSILSPSRVGMGIRELQHRTGVGAAMVRSARNTPWVRLGCALPARPFQKSFVCLYEKQLLG